MPNNELITKAEELMEEGTREFLKLDQKMRDEAVIVSGITGIGKSTLLNYINGIVLEAFLDPIRGYLLRPKVSGSELSGMEIGHSRVSCTRVPGIFSPPDGSVTYIDPPGFDDTGENGDSEQARAARDIANAYLRYLVSQIHIRSAPLTIEAGRL